MNVEAKCSICLTVFTGLTLITVAWYTRETVRLRKAAEQQNESASLPIVVLDSDGTKFLLRNIGRGPALDVDDVRLVIGSETRYLHHSALIPAGQTIEAAAGDLKPDSLRETVKVLKAQSAQGPSRAVCVRYKGSDGIWNETRQHVDVGETNELIIAYDSIHAYSSKNAACQ